MREIRIPRYHPDIPRQGQVISWGIVRSENLGGMEPTWMDLRRFPIRQYPQGFINHFVLNNTALLLPAIVDPATLYKAQG